MRVNIDCSFTPGSPGNFNMNRMTFKRWGRTWNHFLVDALIALSMIYKGSTPIINGKIDKSRQTI